MVHKVNYNKVMMIETIRQFPYLYDRSLDDYRDKEKVDAKWDEIAEEYGFKDGEEVKYVWTNMVKARARCRNEEIKRGRAKTYLYDAHLAFLDDVNQHSNRSFPMLDENHMSNQDWLALMVANGTRSVEDDGQSTSDGQRADTQSNSDGQPGNGQSASDNQRPDGQVGNGQSASDIQRHEIKGPEPKRPRLFLNSVSTHVNSVKPINSFSSMNGMNKNRETMGDAFGRTVAIALDRLGGKVQMQAQVEIMQVLLKYAED